MNVLRILYNKASKCCAYSIGRGLLGQKVARNVFSWHPSDKHLVYDLFERHIGTLQPKKVPKPKTCPIPRKQLICRYVILY